MKKAAISFMISILIVSLMLIGGCISSSARSGQEAIPIKTNSACSNSSSTCPVESPTANSQIANPAAAFCIEKGFKEEIRTAADGSQSGFCIGNGKECDEWQFYRGECSL